MKSHDTLNDIFDIAPVQETPLIMVEPVESKGEDRDLMDDYTKTRDTLNRILVKTEAALDDMLECARNTEKGRDFEVVGQLAKTLTEVSDRILEVHTKMNQLKKKQDKEDTKKVDIQQQNNIVFSGSPSELIEMMKKK